MATARWVAASVRNPDVYNGHKEFIVATGTDIGFATFDSADGWCGDFVGNEEFYWLEGLYLPKRKQNKSRYMSARETASALGLSEKLIRDLINTDKCPGFWSGTKFLIDVPAFTKGLNAVSTSSCTNIRDTDFLALCKGGAE